MSPLRRKKGAAPEPVRVRTSNGSDAVIALDGDDGIRFEWPTGGCGVRRFTLDSMRDILASFEMLVPYGDVWMECADRAQLGFACKVDDGDFYANGSPSGNLFAPWEPIRAALHEFVNPQGQEGQVMT